MQQKLLSIIMSCLFTFFISTSYASEKIASPAPLAKINVNVAAVTQLSHSIKGIGIKRAEAIVKYRDQHGKFQSLNDLAKVPGIGEKFVTKNIERIKQLLTV